MLTDAHVPVRSYRRSCRPRYRQWLRHVQGWLCRGRCSPRCESSMIARVVLSLMPVHRSSPPSSVARVTKA